jgi:lipid II:glycine glycyltransferase (peptidoglycan interpeptide bridge formation enzyme)
MKDLSGFKSVDELRASYKKNVRNKLRKCSPDLTIREVTDDADLEKIAFAIEGSNEKNGMKSRSHDYYRFIRDAYGEQVHFVLAERKEDGATVAVRVIFDHPNETISFISGTVQEYRRMNAMTVLQDDLLTKCFNKGVKRVNFYGMAGDFSSNNHLLEFKSGFGIKVEEYIGGFRIVLDKKKYQLKRAKNVVRRSVGFMKRKISK